MRTHICCRHPGVTLVAGLVAAVILTTTSVLPDREVAGSAVWYAWLLLLLYVLLKAVGWSVSYFVVTSRRILMVTGLVARKVGVIPLELVNDLSYRHSFAGRALGYAEFFVRYGSQHQVLQRIQYLPFPEQLHLEIRTLLSPPGDVPPADEPDEAAAGDEPES